MKCWVGGSVFFHSCFSKIMLSILFTRRKVKFHVICDRENNNNNTMYLWHRNLLFITYYKRNFSLIFLTEISQIKWKCWIYAYLTNQFRRLLSISQRPILFRRHFQISLFTEWAWKEGVVAYARTSLSVMNTG